ncbi:MAG TPA: VCBS repeat-containing protein [Gemmataceae bacterium]|jgi:hypothetical protein
MTPTRTDTAKPAAAAKKPRRWRRYAVAAALLVVGLAAAAEVEMWRIDQDAERFAETGKAVIGLLGDYGAAVGKLDVAAAVDCFASDYASDTEGDWGERLRSDRDGVRVYDWHQENVRPFTRDDLAKRFTAYFATRRTIDESKFKLSWIEDIPADGRAVVRAVMWHRGTTTAGEAFEVHTAFRLWVAATAGGWKITRQEMLHGETVTGDRSGFTDVTARAGIDFRARHNPLFQTPEWEPAKYQIMKYAGGGVSVADVENRGWYDVLLIDPGTGPRLYRNNEDGTFTDVTARSGLPAELPGCAVAIVADFNNDGRKDVFFGVSTGENRIYRNDGPGPDGVWRFTDVTEGAGLGGLWVAVAAAADYDNDGKLDIYVGRYLDPRKNLPTTLFYTRNSEGNSLLHNDGDFHFTDVTAKAGVRDGGLTLGTAWGDFNKDGYVDLFVSNDFGRNALYRNNGDGTFTDVSKETGALDFGYSMSAFMGDINNDGNLDIYVSKVHSGQRWFGHAPSMHKYLLTSFREGTLSEDVGVYRELYGLIGGQWHTIGEKWIRGNSLLLNDGAGHFRDVGEDANANPFGWFWSSAMLDYDNDGLQDLFAVNGWITGKTKDDL